MNIPRRFHRLWLGGEEPEWTQDFARSWAEHHPRWRIHEWTDENVWTLFPLRNQRLYDTAPEITEHVGQLRSDILRYELLHRFGGVWIDTDLECLRSVEPLISEVECFAAWERQDRWVGNTFIGCIPGHPFLERLIAAAPASVARNKGKRPNRMTGPHLVTRLYREEPEELTVLDERLIFPFGWDEAPDFTPGIDAGAKWPRSVAVHWWANQRRQKGLAVA